MLPTNPRPRLRGLPSAPRSRSTGPTRRNASHSDSPLPQIKHQSARSITSSPRESSRSRPPPSTTPSDSSTMEWQRKHTPQSQMQSRVSQDSSDSAASSVSLLFDRVRSGAASYTSSFTSVEDSSTDADQDRRGRSLKKQRIISPEPPPSQESEGTDTGTGDGYTVWSRVAAAAGSLTISVSKAWAANITVYAGEETPPGEESRLCRAMKAYHLSQCQDREDLPSWLFSESERLPRSRTRPPTAAVTEADKPRISTRNRHLLVAESASRPPNDHQSVKQEIPNQAPKASTDRLRQLREVKRQANAQAEQPPVRNAYTGPRQRIGLPTGPAQRRK
ncbi:hypothetical protein D9757_001926 [Collybiopsis confluens]|uniref:Uncharacterized protein n=1 Tax=Collybiopsis confluens TaxID=2823264 RepID=A0A8H5HXJ4_9AGAR|nr:hypothetical protein D9757_001926 [Collybiopsis confluens]